MTLGWKQTYAELEGYIAANPEIKISKGITVLPDSNREEFYRLFDNVRLAFLKEQIPDIYADACDLSKNYLPEAAKLEETLKLTEIKTVPRLDWVLGDPIKGVSRALFDPLFDFLKGGKTIEEFESDAEYAARAYWQPLFKRGYESWVILSIANLLSPEKVLAPSWDEIKQACHELQPDEKRGWCEEFVPEPQEVERIELGHEGYDPAFMVPDIILYSRDLKKYVSLGLT